MDQLLLLSIDFEIKPQVSESIKLKWTFDPKTKIEIKSNNGNRIQKDEI